MRQFIFYLALVLCSLFLFTKTTDAHPHKLGEVNHGSSLATYNIKINFSYKQNTSHGITTNIELADKNKDNKQVSVKEFNKTKVKQKITTVKKTTKRK
jgi:hypothetical protein